MQLNNRSKEAGETDRFRQYRGLAYTLACLLMLFYFILTFNLTLNNHGLLDAVSFTLFFTGIGLFAILIHPVVGTMLITLMVLIIISINTGSGLYHELYQSYVPASILSLRDELPVFLKSIPAANHLYAFTGILFLIVILHFALKRIPTSPSVATMLIAVGLTGSALYLQIQHDQRENKQFSKNSESPVGFFLRSADVVPVINGNPLIARYTQIESYVAAARRNQQIDTELMDAIKKYYPDSNNQGLYPLYQGSGLAHSTEMQARPKNVILLVLESVRDSESGRHSTLQSATPFLDSLKEMSFHSSDNYSTAAFTTKSETAILCGIMDHLGGETASIREADIQATCLPDLLAKHGYERYWFHGNDIEFYNRKYFLPEVGFNRIRGIEYYYGKDVPTQTAIIDKEKPVLGWGIPDPDLFDLALDELMREEKPFFAEILTVTNHLPFKWEWGIEFPEHLTEKPSDTMYEGYRRGIYYTDKAVERFVSRFTNSSLYENTLLVITGDHGIWTFGNQRLSEINKFNQFFQVPLLFYGKSIQPGMVAGPSSHLDVAPTILDILGIDEPTAFLGNSLLNQEVESKKRPIFMTLETAFAFRKGDAMCIPKGRCFRNGIDECQGWEKKSMEKANHICYDVSDADLFTSQRPVVTLAESEFESIENLFNYALVGLELGFAPLDTGMYTRSPAEHHVFKSEQKHVIVLDDPADINRL
jgi:phosphoglycerol transferase MdoB-like AlkP superfamily enzyme